MSAEAAAVRHEKLIGTPIKEYGVFGKCSCGGDVKFHTNGSVACSGCHKLYGIWFLKGKK